ncbi:MAG TPA: type II secretion system protein [Lacipirellulaceae bacterium]|nr:type II secretion system protein [Lacipirellulaceae bacterium]HMP06401.1 type II secretion system protein [Lacipirellulaceae bacterium]
MPPTNRPRRAFTLVETIAATAIMAVLATASFALVRTANTAWLRHRDDSNQRREASAAMQHIVRRVRQAKCVTSISAAADPAGSLSLALPGNTTAAWNRHAGTNQVRFGTATPAELLATGITELRFVGLKANGSTPTTELGLIHAVQCTLRYSLARPAGPMTETLSCTAWLRAW